MRDLTGLTTTVNIRDDEGRVVETREVVLYRTLLDLAHTEGISGIITKMLQAPNPQNGNTCIFRAEVTTEKGVFTGIGDATPGNVDPNIAQHFIRAAETRAKARALRDALNIGVVTLEEIRGNGYYTGLQDARTQKAGKSKIDKSRNHKGEKNKGGDDDNSFITEAQRKYLFRLLADQGLEGKEALGYILDECGVNSIKDVPRKVASDLIAKLKGDDQPKTENDDMPF